MVKKVSDRSRIPPFRVLEFAAQAIAKEQRGEEVYHMDMGQPGFGAPRGVIDAAHAALENNRIGYSESQGNLALREKIAAYYGDNYGLEVSTDEIFITTGSSGAFLLAFLCAFDVGDSIALALPAYPCYLQVPHLLGLKTVALEAQLHDHFQPTVTLLEKAMETQRIDGLIIAGPANPSGYAMAAAQLAEVVDFCKEHEIRIISDEIYHGITYDGAAAIASVRGLDDSAIIINSFSKYFCMSGWRLGWMLAPQDLRRAFLSAAQNLYISAPVISQLAAIAAFDCRDELAQKVEEYAASRALLLDELPRLGFRNIIAPDGGFYIYAEIPESVSDSSEFCRLLLDECGVAIIPGLDFDPVRGERTVRLSYADTHASIERALVRLRVFKQAGGF